MESRETWRGNMQITLSLILVLFLTSSITAAQRSKIQEGHTGTKRKTATRVEGRAEVRALNQSTCHYQLAFIGERRGTQRWPSSEEGEFSRATLIKLSKAYLRNTPKDLVFEDGQQGSVTVKGGVNFRTLFVGDTVKLIYKKSGKEQVLTFKVRGNEFDSIEAFDEKNQMHLQIMRMYSEVSLSLWSEATAAKKTSFRGNVGEFAEGVEGNLRESDLRKLAKATMRNSGRDLVFDRGERKSGTFGGYERVGDSVTVRGGLNPRTLFEGDKLKVVHTKSGKEDPVVYRVSDSNGGLNAVSESGKHLYISQNGPVYTLSYYEGDRGSAKERRTRRFFKLVQKKGAWVSTTHDELEGESDF